MNIKKCIGYIFPFQKNEIVKILSLSLLIIFLLFNRNIISSVRDSLIAIEGESEILSFVKIWFELPIGIFMVFIYHKMSKKFSEHTLFAIYLSAFIVSFLTIGFLLLPNSNIIHPNHLLIEQLLLKFPYLYGFIVIWSKWSIVLFYVLNEIWTTLTCSLMFWKLVSMVVDQKEQAKYFLFLSMIGQMNLLISGKITFYISNYVKQNSLNSYFLIKISVVIFSILGILAIVLQNFIVKNYKFYDLDNISNQPTNSQKMNLIQAIKILFSSVLIKHLCLMSICYSAIMAIVEGISMCMTKKYFTSISTYCNFQGTIMYYIGLFTIVFSVIGRILLKKYGWYLLALVTPIASLIFGVCFFTSVLLHQLNFFSIKIVINSIFLLLVVIKSTKYTLFDSSKAIAYTKIPKELESDGRAVIAFLGDNVGRSFGSLFQMIIFSFFPYSKHDDIVIHLFLLFIVVSFFWIKSTHAFNQITQS